ncbi:RNA methyltransferase, RsmE family [Thermanaerovibrio velox DSM 12556]|uniref:Ribosomal RNA small subunit methyltransferase E n=1 Tax=Thermanaerovibrio velox DSM 12556 TaxID=926567 RepID=H0USK8_9BACT|nr:RNA methyltransferase, RsmE family [Thermanaerovibrio velox DSM 12556]
MHRLRLESCTKTGEGRYLLDQAQARHLTKVLRCYTGALVEGLCQEGSVLLRIQVTPYGVEALEVSSSPGVDYLRRVDLLVGFLKADQWDQVLRVACELGVARIWPVLCERSVPRPDDWGRKKERYERILFESTRQCGALRAPELMDLKPLDVLDLSELPEVRLGAFLSPDSVPLVSALPEGDLAIAVGPEGDWTAREVEILKGAGFKAVSLGPRVLRASTAVAAALGAARILHPEVCSL